MREFATGPIQSVAAPGVAQAHPSFRWGGSPVAAVHTRMTHWALGLISTVRIGVGACLLGQALEKAATPVGNSH
jgi:hypothetical protein